MIYQPSIKITVTALSLSKSQKFKSLAPPTPPRIFPIVMNSMKKSSKIGENQPLSTCQVISCTEFETNRSLLLRSVSESNTKARLVFFNGIFKIRFLEILAASANYRQVFVQTVTYNNVSLHEIRMQKTSFQDH